MTARATGPRPGEAAATGRERAGEAAGRRGSRAPGGSPRGDVLFILGMHRSGTSFLASCAPAFGYRLPRDMAGPQDDNPKGHFEPAAVVAFNDSWLGERGHGWDRIVPPAEDETSPPAAIARTGGATEEAAVAALRQSFGRAGRICIKDPRLAFTLPVWRRVVAAAGMAPRCLITVRDPAEVARSLGRRDGLPSGLCAVMWTIQTIAAFRASAGLPRAVLIYPDWAADPGAALSAAFPRCGIAARPDRAATAVRSLFAPAAGPEPADPLPGEAGAVARALFEAVRDAAGDGGAPPEDVLADAGRAVEAAGAAAIAAARTASGRILAAQGLAHRLAQEGQAASARAAGAEATARRLARQLAATERQRDAEAQRLRGVARDYRALEGTLRRTEAQRDRVLGLLAAGEARAAVAEAARASAEAARKAERDAALAERDAAQAERDAAAAARDAALAGQDAAVGALAVCRQEATALTGEIASLRGEIDAVRAERDSLRRLLEETEMRYRAERLTVLRPAYRKVYRAAGRGLRLCLPAPAVERLKRIVPHPDAIPAALAHVPLPPPQPAHPGAAAVRPADPSGPPDIFVFAIIDWDFRVQRPQHLAREFARRGHRVFYVEMQSGTGGTDLRGIDEGLFVLRLGAGPAGFPAPYTGRPTPEQTRDFLDRFDAFCDRAGTTPERLVVVQHPFWWPFLRHLGGDNRLVLDCMDEIAGFANTEPHVLEAEAELAAGCDRIVVSSAWLEGKHAGRAGDVRLVRNAVDPAAFRLRRGGAVPVPAWLPAAQEGPSGPALKAGYVGAIAEWFDVDLLAATARLCPDIAFHLCGAVTAPDALRLGDLPNVTLHGEIPYADVPGFIAAMDVMTIPFRLLPIIRACDPVKFYEHCAAGRPTVATALPELDRAGDLVFRAGAPADFAAGLRAAAAAGRDPAFVARLEAYAAANTWAARAADFLDHVLDVPLVSAVILSHGRPDLTLAALESLAGERPAYPRLDIIVVDNASDPADLAALRRGLSRFPAVRLVEAPRNLGFAAGNNLGIAAARGDFVLLLNSDTFVPEGAIAAMLRHLQRNPRIGVVGPLTNRIGNEAQVPVAYGDIAGMRQAARRLVRGYRGTWTEVEVCAYFCVMFRAADLARFGPLPEIYGTGMFEDDDHCRTIRAMGFSCALAEDAFVHHHLSASFEALGAEARARLFARNRQIFEGRWGPWTPHRHRDVRPPDRIGVAA